VPRCSRQEDGGREGGREGGKIIGGKKLSLRDVGRNAARDPSENVFH